MDLLDAGEVFASLSVKDLLEARDLYHNHLTGKPNVVGTAIGYYLMRDVDTTGRSAEPSGRPTPRSEERRLDNAFVRTESSPCVLAFVTEWLAPDRFGGAGKYRPDDAVPTRLYMPDGRVVPVCVVKVEPMEPAPRPRALASSWL